ncbi:MAG: carbonate dehydratase [Xanthomonadales bacterium]|nr:carbonate dehydratase [Xanthomonadales bacterium]
MKKLEHLFKNNTDWAEKIKAENPNFFKELAEQQSPEYLWIGCSDSRVPANQLLSLAPGEVFVHRNIANVVVHTDINCLSVLQFAVDVLKVKHIIVCGHYGCGGINAAINKTKHGHNTREANLIDNWLGHIEDVARFHKDELQNLNEEQYQQRLCELNVIEQVNNVCNTSIVNKAWNEGADLTVHGWIYDINNGILKDLDASTNTSEKRKH